MPQKALKPGGKKIVKLGKKPPRVNKNWKKAIQKKGSFAFTTKSPTSTQNASREMTREVNLKNELESARRATQSGGKMLVVRPPPDAAVEVRGPKPKLTRKQRPVVEVPYRF
jgi:hypothetical protein